MMQILARANGECMAEIMHPEVVPASSPSAEDTERERNRWFEGVLAKHAALFVQDAAAVFRRFYPDMTTAELSEHVHSLSHSDSHLAGADPCLRDSIRSLVPLDRKTWVSEDVMEHVAMQRGHLRRGRRLVLQAKGLAKDPRLRTVAMSGTGGAVVLGALGAQVGLVAGMAAGALAGAPLAFFTFFLSIPTFAAVGGGVGACAGAVAGAGTGLVGGSAVGGLGFAYRSELKVLASDIAEYTQAKAGVCTDIVKSVFVETLVWRKRRDWTWRR